MTATLYPHPHHQRPAATRPPTRPRGRWRRRWHRFVTPLGVFVLLLVVTGVALNICVRSTVHSAPARQRSVATRRPLAHFGWVWVT